MVGGEALMAAVEVDDGDVLKVAGCLGGGTIAGIEVAQRDGFGRGDEAMRVGAGQGRADLGGGLIERGEDIRPPLAVDPDGAGEVELEAAEAEARDEVGDGLELAQVGGEDLDADEVAEGRAGGEMTEAGDGLIEGAEVGRDPIMGVRGGAEQRDLEEVDARADEAIEVGLVGEHSAVGLDLDEAVAELAGGAGERREIGAQGRLAAHDHELVTAALAGGDELGERGFGAAFLVGRDVGDGAVRTCAVAPGV